MDQKSIANEKVNIAYSDEPWWYDIRGYLIFKFAYRCSLRKQIIFFATNIKEFHLEVAIGSGSLFRLILLYMRLAKKTFKQVDGLDYADRMINSAKKTLRHFKNVNLFKADASDTQLKSESYQSINIANAIHCLPNIESTLLELHRVLAPSGTLAGNCLLYPKNQSFLDNISNKINSWGIKKGILIRPYHVNEIKSLLKKAGFHIVFEEIEGNCFNFIVQKI